MFYRGRWQSLRALNTGLQVVIAAAVLFLVGSFSSVAVGYRPDRILVQLRPGVSPAAIARFHSTHKVTQVGDTQFGGHLQVLAVPPGANIPALIEDYRRSELVVFAEPDYIRHIAVNIPDDPKFLDGTLWGLNNYGQNSGTPGADIGAPEAWDCLTSAGDVVVAVVDSGVRYTHEDLAENMWTSSVDGSHGWNALTGTNNPADSSGHGTLTAGVLGAVGNNGKGLVGVAWRAQIMACTCFDANGNGSDSDIIACLDYARTNGARIINASWGSYTNSLALSNAIYQLREDGIILVAAAGNDTRNIDVTPYYPAAFGFDNIVSVAYTTRNDNLGAFSNFGATNVDIAAPGAAMYSTFFASDSSYLGGSYLEGTSLAAPVVTGALALLSNKYRAESHEQIIARLLRASVPLPALAGKCRTGGRLNLHRALDPPILLAVHVSGDTVHLRVSSEPGTLVVVEAGSDLAHWSPVQTNTTPAAGSFEYSEPQTVTMPPRFYRAFAKP